MALAALLALVFAPIAGVAQSRKQPVVAGNEITITVTAHPHDDRTRANARQIQAADFTVREDKRPQQIISVRKATEAPPVIAVLIQDDLISQVNNELRVLKQFIRALPEGSRVMVGYVTSGSLGVAQDFTTDRERAAGSLRVVRSSESGSPFNPYVELIEALRKFDSQPAGRRLVLFVSDGLDISRGFASASPSLSLDLDRAIREAQRRGVTIYSIYSPAVGLTGRSRLASNYGQSSLNKLSDDTGGEAFFSGSSFVSFDPYLKEMNELLDMQWVITYRSNNTGSGFRQIEVSVEPEVHLHHIEGYRMR